MTKRNMKIEINESQPLDEVVRELDRLGHKLSAIMINSVWIVCRFRGDFIGVDNTYPEPPNFYKLTTLAELKSM